MDGTKPPQANDPGYTPSGSEIHRVQHLAQSANRRVGIDVGRETCIWDKDVAPSNYANVST